MTTSLPEALTCLEAEDVGNVEVALALALAQSRSNSSSMSFTIPATTQVVCNIPAALVGGMITDLERGLNMHAFQRSTLIYEHTLGRTRMPNAPRSSASCTSTISHALSHSRINSSMASDEQAKRLQAWQGGLLKKDAEKKAEE